MKISQILVVVLIFLVNSMSHAAINVGIVVSSDSASSTGISQTLEDLPEDYKVRTIDRVHPDVLSDVDVLILSEYKKEQVGTIRTFVQQGGGIIVLCAKADGLFPELVQPFDLGSWQVSIPSQMLKPIRNHPITKGVSAKGFRCSFPAGRMSLFPADDRFVLMEDQPVADGHQSNRMQGSQLRWFNCYGGNAVLMAAPFARGRVVVCGFLMGAKAWKKEVPRKVDGDEKTLLQNSIAWAAGQRPLGVPEACPKTQQGSKYRKQIFPGPDVYDKGAIAVIDGPNDAPGKGTASSFKVSFMLASDAPLGMYTPLSMVLSKACDVNEGIVLDNVGREVARVPVQVERNEQGQSKINFIACLSTRKNTMIFHKNADRKPGLTVRINRDASLAEVTGETFRLLLAGEQGQATIQSLEIFDPQWHHTWDGLERMSLSAPLLRLSPTLWPFEELPPSVFSEKGRSFPAFIGNGVKEHRAYVKMQIRVGAGEMTVYSTGLMKLSNVFGSGRIATWGFDGYQADKEWYEETASYDFPGVQAPSGWVWGIKQDRYALGGSYRIVNIMGETGLSPGLERQISLDGDVLAVVTNLDNLGRYGGNLTEIEVSATVLETNCTVPSENNPDVVRLAKRTIQLRKLLKMRDTNMFFPLLPRPLEIYKDEIPEGNSLARIELTVSDKAPVQISARMDGEFGEAVSMEQVREAIQLYDPENEDTDVAARVFLTYRGTEYPRTFEISLQLKDAQGRLVGVVPVLVNASITAPLGIFTYHEHGPHQPALIPASQWSKMTRDIALNGMDYVIQRPERPGMEPQTISLRSRRYGLWWLPYLRYAAEDYLRDVLAENKPGDIQNLEKNYRQGMTPLLKYPNIIAWYLSDELARGEPKDGLLPVQYRAANTLYDSCKKVDPHRIAVNLFCTWHTPIATAAKHLKSDVLSWDPYKNGTQQIENETRIVRSVWRNAYHKPVWVTLQCCGPTFYDTFDLWLDIRKRSVAAYNGMCDSVNYFMYAHWMSDFQVHTWYAVIPGSKGPIATPRWQTLYQFAKDMELLVMAEYVCNNFDATGKILDSEELDYLTHGLYLAEAKQLGRSGKFYQMRKVLRHIIQIAGPTKITDTDNMTDLLPD